MAPDNDNSLTTRERLEFLLDEDCPGSTYARKPGSKQENGLIETTSQRRAFLAGVAFSGLLASSILLTHYIDGRLQPSATEGSSASTRRVDAVAATGTAGATVPAVLAASTISPAHSPLASTPPPSNSDPLPGTGPVPSSLVSDSVPPPVPPSESKPLSKISGLSTSRSVITGVADPQTLTASYYWTFTLKNTTRSQQEAQMKISLPDGAVVSRATLWINGKAQEAAFNSTETVEQAYDWIVTLHRDPLLIKQIDSKHINLKASPVMPNKEMKIRIGMTVPMTATADGSTHMELPQISEANLDTSCVQNIHITSNTPISGNNTHLTATPHKAGYLLKGNLMTEDLSTLQVTMARNSQLTRFATRATHSFPPSFIVGELKPDIQGLNKLILSKEEVKPDCPVLNDDDAAFRLSYLWAKEEIDRLIQDGDRYQAVELATVYRVVSPVSGAVVLEKNSDYEYNGLDRNLYRSMSYSRRMKPQQMIEGEAQGGAGGTGGSPFAYDKTPRPSAAPQSAPSPDTSRSSSYRATDDLSAIKESSKLWATDSVHTKPRSQTHAEAKQPGQSYVVKRAGAVTPAPAPAPARKAEQEQRALSAASMPAPSPMREANKATPSTESDTNFNYSTSQEEEGQRAATGALRMKAPTPGRLEAQPVKPEAANLETPSDRLVKLAGPVANWLQHSSALRENTTLATALLLGCIGLTFAGGLGLLIVAAMRGCLKQRGYIQLAAAGTTWLLLAAWWPLFSQVTFVVFGLAFLAQTTWNKAKHLTAGGRRLDAPSAVQNLRTR